MLDLPYNNSLYPYSGNNYAPYVIVKMSKEVSSDDKWPFIEGKVDTGADITVLKYEDAKRMGIEILKTPKTTKQVVTATGQQVTGYVHEVLVKTHIGDSLITFELEVTFVKKLVENLFGRDWLTHMAWAFDYDSFSLFTTKDYT